MSRTSSYRKLRQLIEHDREASKLNLRAADALEFYQDRYTPMLETLNLNTRTIAAGAELVRQLADTLRAADAKITELERIIERKNVVRDRIMSIGAQSGSDLNAWNKAFDIVMEDRLAD